MNESRRRFLQTASLGVATAACAAIPPQASARQVDHSKPSGVLFEGYLFPARPKGLYETTLAAQSDGEYWLLWGDHERHLCRKTSPDGGRTWGEAEPLRDQDGAFIPLARGTAHLSLLELKSGGLGIVYGGPYVRPGRDGTVLFRTSRDGGRSWSNPVAVDPLFSVTQKGTARVLQSGRILAPAFSWVSAQPGPSSEEEVHHLSYGWIFYSDDEGQTWKRSLSELYVAVDRGRLGSYSIEEPCLEVLRDGSLLLFGRTELGCFYQSKSTDDGVSWSEPKPVPLAAAYTPPYLIRIPATGDLLLIWDQASSEEIVAGLARHRLSTAISSDDGATWRHLRNLESLDDRTEIRPPQGPPTVYRMTHFDFRQPVDLTRYPHAPGCSRVCYPDAAFRGNEVAIAYDYGYGGPGELKDGSTTKIKVVSVDWLYERV